MKNRGEPDDADHERERRTLEVSTAELQGESKSQKDPCEEQNHTGLGEAILRQEDTENEKQGCAQGGTRAEDNSRRGYSRKRSTVGVTSVRRLMRAANSRRFSPATMHGTGFRVCDLVVRSSMLP